MTEICSVSSHDVDTVRFTTKVEHVCPFDDQVRDCDEVTVEIQPIDQVPEIQSWEAWCETFFDRRISSEELASEVLSAVSAIDPKAFVKVTVEGWHFRTKLVVETCSI